MFMLFTEARITRPKRYAEKCYIRESAQTPSARTLYATKVWVRHIRETTRVDSTQTRVKSMNIS